MKFCPNPDCSGLAEFRIVSEFNDTATVCGDCGGPLKDGPAPDPRDLIGKSEPVPDAELVSVGTVKGEAELIMAKEALDMAGIRFMVKGEGIQHLFVYGQITPVNPVTGPMEIFVLETETEKAKDVIRDFVG